MKGNSGGQRELQFFHKHFFISMDKGQCQDMKKRKASTGGGCRKENPVQWWRSCSAKSDCLLKEKLSKLKFTEISRRYLALKKRQT